MQDGIDLNPQVLIAVQNERIASAAMREAQLTAAVQQLTMRVMELESQVETLTPDTEDEDAEPSSG